MPQTGWLCTFNDEVKTFKQCMECSKSDEHCEFTPEMFYVMQRVSSSAKDPLNPSVTQILKECMRQVVIQDRFDYQVYPRRAWFLLRGNMIHYLFEETLPKDGWKELYNSRPITLPNGVTVNIGGKVDKLVIEKKLIRDYKTAKKVPTRTRNGYSHHGEQVNIYRWIWWPIFQAEKLRLQYIDMSGTKQVKVDCMDIKEVEKMVKEKAYNYYLALTSKEVPKGEYDSTNWVCKYCDVSNICKKLNEGGTNGKRERKSQSESRDRDRVKEDNDEGRAGRKKTRG